MLNITEEYDFSEKSKPNKENFDYYMFGLHAVKAAIENLAVKNMSYGSTKMQEPRFSAV